MLDNVTPKSLSLTFPRSSELANAWLFRIFAMRFAPIASLEWVVAKLLVSATLLSSYAFQPVLWWWAPCFVLLALPLFWNVSYV
jgi:CBS domain containing-hemolysin-like protein